MALPCRLLERLCSATSLPVRWFWWVLAATAQLLYLGLLHYHRRWLEGHYEREDEDRQRRWQQYIDARITMESTHSLDARERARHFADRVELEHARLDALVKLYRRELEALDAKIEAARDFASLAALRRSLPQVSPRAAARASDAPPE